MGTCLTHSAQANQANAAQADQAAPHAAPVNLPSDVYTLREQARAQKVIYSTNIRVGRYWIPRKRIHEGPVYLNPNHNIQACDTNRACFKLHGCVTSASIVGERRVDLAIEPDESHVWIFPECKQIMEVYGYDNRFIIEDLDVIRVYDVAPDMGLKQIMRAETKETIRLITESCIVTAPVDNLQKYTVWHHRNRQL